MAYFLCGEGSNVTVTIDGVEVENDLALVSDGAIGVEVSTLPYEFQYGNAIEYENEIHLLGGSGNKTGHYKYNGTSWTSVGNLPYEFYDGDAVVYRNEIHLLGGYTNKTGHYKYNGTSWTSVGNLSYEFYKGDAVVYEDELYLLGGVAYASFNQAWLGQGWNSKFNGTSWSSTGFSLPSNDMYSGDVVAYDGYIYYIAGSSWLRKNNNSTSWRGLGGDIPLPYSFQYGKAIVYENEIHLLGGSGNKTAHYKYYGTSWTSVSTLPYDFYYGDAVVYNKAINLLGGSASTTNHYALRNIYTKGGAA